MTGEQWVAFGRLLFTTNTYGFQRWLDGKGPLPESKDFEFWCPLCQEKFISKTTPRKCLRGHTTEEIGEDAVIVIHKGYEGKTFPFHIMQERMCLR